MTGRTGRRILVAAALVLLTALAGWVVLSASTELGEAQRAHNTGSFNVGDVRLAAKWDFAFMAAYLALGSYLFWLIGWKRPSVQAGWLLAAGGTAADGVENLLLLRALDGHDVWDRMRAAGLVKYGLLGTSLLIFIALVWVRAWRPANPLGSPGDRPPKAKWDPTPGRIGVALSGGGIRSAAFSLGALQALRENEKLDQAEYITAVSGGGYLAAGWALAQAETGPATGAAPPPWAQGSPEERWFRNHSSYLIPDFKGGVAGLVRLLAGVLVNVVLVGMLLVAASKPVGWAIHAAHKELRAKEPVVVPVDVVGAMNVKDPLTLLGKADKATLYRLELEPAPGNEACFDKAPFDDKRDICVRVVQDEHGVVEVKEGKAKVVRQPKAKVLTGASELQGKAAVAKDPRVDVVNEFVVDGAAPGAGQFTVGGQPKVVAKTGLTMPWPDYRSWMWELVAGLLGGAVLMALAVTVFRPRGEAGKVVRTMAKALAAAGAAVFLVVIALPWVAVWLPRTLAAWSKTTSDSLSGSSFYDYLVPGGGLLAVVLAAANQFLAGSKSKPGSGTGDTKPFYSRFWEMLTKRKAELKWYETSPAKIAVALATSAAAVVVFVNSLQFSVANGLSGELMGFAFARGFLPSWAFVPDMAEFAAIVVALVAFAFAADAHTWSLFPFYKERLSSAFLLRRNDKGQAEPLEFKDLVPMTRLKGAKGPQLVACCAVNLGEPGVVPPGRRAASFTFSATEIGGPLVGYAEPEQYDRLRLPRRRDVTLASAMAISGAAFSPAMGKFNLGPVGSLLALANLRLGVWIPNPCMVRDKSKDEALREWSRLRLRRPHWMWFIRELTNKYSFNRRYLYVSDGGHWDNLGLVELLRRGCTEVYCISGAGDGPDSFGTLAEAIALAREELGVEIDLDPSPLRQPVKGESAGGRELRRAGAKDKAAPFAPASAVKGTITFTRCTPKVKGVIYYAEADLTADMPFDVHAFAEAELDFPDDPTGDQVFNHRQFESYRALGHHQAEAAFALTKPPPAEPSCWTKVGRKVKKAVCD